MVATLLKLKFLLLKNSLKRSVWQIIGIVVGGLYGLFILGILLVGLFVLKDAELESKSLVMVLGGTLLVTGWWILPVIASGLDQTLDPSRFIHLPLRRGQLMTGLVLSGFVGVPGIVTLLVVLAATLIWLPNLAAFVAALVAAVLSLAMMQLGARALATLFTRILTGRRGQEILATAAIIFAVTLGPLFALFANQINKVGQIDENVFVALLEKIADVFAWLPMGVLWQSPADIAAGEFLLGGFRLVYGLGFVWALARVWAYLFEKATTTAPKQSTATQIKTSRLDSFAQGPISAVAVRTLKYWRRDSRLAISNVITLLLPLVFFAMYGFGFGLQISAQWILAMGPLVAALYGWGLHNMLAYDGSAFWLHISTGLRGKHDRLGRLIAEGGTGLIIVTLIVMGAGWITGRWDLFLITYATSILVLAATTAISTYMSTIWIYAVPGPGENPFNTSTGVGAIALVAQMVTLVAGGILSLPAAIPFAWTLLGSPPAGLEVVGIISSVIFSPILIWLGVYLGARRLDRDSAEVLLALRKFS